MKKVLFLIVVTIGFSCLNCTLAYLEMPGKPDNIRITSGNVVLNNGLYLFHPINGGNIITIEWDEPSPTPKVYDLQYCFYNDEGDILPETIVANAYTNKTSWIIKKSDFTGNRVSMAISIKSRDWNLFGEKSSEYMNIPHIKKDTSL